MDISAALESCSKAIVALKSFPKRSRVPRDDVLYMPKSQADKTRWLDIQRCIPFLHKIIGEIKSHIARFDSRYFENVENRQSFIDKRLAENSKESRYLADKIKLINEIEQYEKMDLIQFESIVFDRNESVEIMRRLHDPDTVFENKQLERILQKYISLDFDYVDPKEMEAYQKIITMVDNSPG